MSAVSSNCIALGKLDPLLNFASYVNVQLQLGENVYQSKAKFNQGSPMLQYLSSMCDGVILETVHYGAIIRLKIISSQSYGAGNCPVTFIEYVFIFDVSTVYTLNYRVAGLKLTNDPSKAVPSARVAVYVNEPQYPALSVNASTYIVRVASVRE